MHSTGNRFAMENLQPAVRDVCFFWDDNTDVPGNLHERSFSDGNVINLSIETVPNRAVLMRLQMNDSGYRSITECTAAYRTLMGRPFEMVKVELSEAPADPAAVAQWTRV